MKRFFLAALVAFLSACGGGGGGTPGPISADVLLLFVSGHDELENDSYLHKADSIGPYLLAQVQQEFPDTVARYYRDGANSATEDGVEYPGSNGFYTDLNSGVQANRICVIAHSHGGPRALDAIRRLPSKTVHHLVLLDTNSYGEDVGAHDDSTADEERIFESISYLYRQFPVSASNTDVLPDDSQIAPGGYKLHQLGQQNVIPWNVWSAFECRLQNGVFDALDDHWALRPDGSDVRITPHIALGDDHGTVHMPAQGSAPAEAASWLLDQLNQPISSGAFSFQGKIGVSETPLPVCAVADFNKDGRKDLALSVGSRVALMRGSSSSSMLSSPSYPITNIYAEQMMVFDADRDDRIDLVLLGDTTVSSDPQVQVWYGKGDATFEDSVLIQGWQVGDHPVSMACADLTGDERPDIVVLTARGEVLLIEKQANSNRVWLAPQSFGFVFEGQTVDGVSVYLEDVTHDDVCDLIVGVVGDGGEGALLLSTGVLVGGRTEFVPNSASQLLASGDRSGAIPLNIAITDVDRDGDRDMIVSAGRDGKLLYLRNNGFGVFSTPGAKAGNYVDTQHGLASADLNGDNRVDLVIARFDRVDVYERVFQNNGSTSAYLPGDVGMNLFEMTALGDFNGDGHLDFATCGFPNAEVAVFSGAQGSGGGGLGEDIPKAR
ncbi:MAG: VCBS repeat-containing protein [Candidatus Paceibacterota bacterium]